VVRLTLFHCLYFDRRLFNSPSAHVYEIFGTIGILTNKTCYWKDLAAAATAALTFDIARALYTFHQARTWPFLSVDLTLASDYRCNHWSTETRYIQRACGAAASGRS
jgi:hypothetical protein